MPDTRRRGTAIDPIDRFVGARIALRRAGLGLSQVALSGLIGVSFQQVQKYETGTNRVSASRLFQIATALGAPVADFFPAGEAEGEDLDWLSSLRFLTASEDGRVMATAFPLIEDRSLRRAVARIVEGLAQAS